MAIGRRRADTWRDCGIPARHKQSPGAQPGPWRDTLNRLVELDGSGFLIALLGGRGTGKTQMGVELIARRVNKAERFTCKYVRAMDVFIDVKESYRRDGPNERDVLKRFIGPQLLVIDEAHERGETAWEDRLLTYIVDRRYGDGKDTLLISNSQHAEFRAAIGESIYSRLVETGGVVVCDWPSFRTAVEQEGK